MIVVVNLSDKEIILIFNLVQTEHQRMISEKQEAYIESTRILLEKLSATGSIPKRNAKQA